MLTAETFQDLVYRYYDAHGRDLPWRQPEADGAFDPYKILVSEMMLQQTQVSRVIPKYETFLRIFPTTQALARAPLGKVLAAWSGLGYNRRAKYLHEAVGQLAAKADWTLADLTACRGIGHNTAAAVVVYAYDQPEPFIETNVRTVYIHHFFPGRSDVSDKEIQAVLQETFDREQPRQFAWALMDYGAHLKATAGNAARYSRHHTKQSKFEGSLRQVRGKVLKSLLAGEHGHQQLAAAITDDRLEQVLRDLQAEGLIVAKRDHYHLP